MDDHHASVHSCRQHLCPGPHTPISRCNVHQLQLPDRTHPGYGRSRCRHPDFRRPGGRGWPRKPLGQDRPVRRSLPVLSARTTLRRNTLGYGGAGQARHAGLPGPTLWSILNRVCASEMRGKEQEHAWVAFPLIRPRAVAGRTAPVSHLKPLRGARFKCRRSTLSTFQQTRKRTFTEEVRPSDLIKAGLMPGVHSLKLRDRHRLPDGHNGYGHAGTASNLLNAAQASTRPNAAGADAPDLTMTGCTVSRKSSRISLGASFGLCSNKSATTPVT